MTEIPLSHGVLPEHLDCVDKLEEILKNPEPVSMDQILAYLSEVANEEGLKIISDIIEHGPAYFQKYKSDLGSPEEIDCIPPIKITQVPMQAADIQPNTSVQNAEVLANIFAQAGIRDPKDILGDRNNYKKKLLTNLGNKAVIIVGDLLTVTSLEEWAAKKPTWEEMRAVTKKVLLEHVASADMGAIHRQETQDWDLVKENMMLFHQQALLYEETSYVMNHGDIGCLEKLFPAWMYTFSGCGKHKYSAEFQCLLENILFRYPQGLRDVIWKNMLVNPTGQPDSFRAIDWVIEHNNLYTKQIYGGQFSNKTVEHVIKESPLIETYKNI
ncbi:hypothetical protein AN958_05373 [Leucoagaricus sp. SymC.cos]|nr:hypothetical protein AN958_05373 [Leucoagaricus sp. SymC.cos]